MTKEIQRQAVKNILNEMSDNAVPFQEVIVKGMQEDWDEEKMAAEMLKLLTPELRAKTFDHYTDRIMGVFYE